MTACSKYAIIEYTLAFVILAYMGVFRDRFSIHAFSDHGSI